MKLFISKLWRRLIRARLARLTTLDLLRRSDALFLKSVKNAIRTSPAYRRILAENKLYLSSPLTTQQILNKFPIVEKKMLFGKFSLQELICEEFKVAQMASILTSSGHGSSGFALGLSTIKQVKASPFMIDFGLDMAFEIDRYSTLLINCLPMGVTFQSNAVCVANVSVREDMACAILEQAGHFFQQIIIVGDPLFLKKFCDYSNAKKIDWGKFKINIVIGEETFPETYRSYLEKKFQINIKKNGGIIISSMGVAELGLNLFTETRETTELRRMLADKIDLLNEIFNTEEKIKTAPTFFIYSPLRIYVEVVNQDRSGIGDLVITILDVKAAVPMIRYRTGDRAAKLDFKKTKEILSDELPDLKNLNLPVLALFGRAKDQLPDKGHVDEYKEALYRDYQIADEVSGAFQLSFHENEFLWEIQLGKMSVAEPTSIEILLANQILERRNNTKIICFPYEKFPYGQSLDYERKFSYWNT
jgi:phenylacetate-CoA ligase